MTTAATTTTITFSCDACERRSTVPAEFAGRRGRCPGCKEVVRVPTQSESTPESMSLGEQAFTLLQAGLFFFGLIVALRLFALACRAFGSTYIY